MATAHQQFKASLDVTAYEKGLQRMESTTRTSTARTAREFDKVQASTSRMFSMGGGMGGGGRGKLAGVGAVSMQIQDVAVQMQMGASAARILAQQGSQIASFFGPGGMIVGGVIALSAMMWESAHAGEEAAKQAEKEAKARKEIAAARARENAVSAIQRDSDAIEVAKVRAEQGDKAADAAERQLKFEREIDQIRRNRDAGNLHPRVAELQAGVADARREAEDKARRVAEARDNGAQDVADRGDAILARADQIRGKGMSKAEQNRENRAQRNAERRAIAEELDAADRKERNELQGTGKARTKGLTEAEKEQAREARKGAVGVAKDKKLQAEISQENIDKILNGIDNLLAK